MFFYIIIFIILGLLAFFVKRNAIVLSLCAISLIAIAGFRGFYIGADTHTYYFYFLSLADGYPGYMEPLWNFLNLVISSLNLNFNAFLLLISALTILPITYIFWKELDNPQFALFLYYAIYAYCNSFNGMRQYLAISLVFVAFYFMRHCKALLALLFIVLASNIHHSALIGLVLFPLYYVRISRTTILLALLISLALGITIFPTIDMAWIYGKYAGYTENDTFIRESITQTLLLTALYNIFSVFIFFTSNKKLLQDFYMKIFFAGNILLNLTMQLALGSRIILYFSIIQTVLLPLYLKQIHSTQIIRLSIYIGVLCYFTAIFLKILILGNFDQFSIFPYEIMIYPKL